MADVDALLQTAPRPMWRLFAYLGPMRGRLSASILSSVTNKVLDLAPPILVAWLIDSVTGNAPAFMGWVGLSDMFAQIVFLAVLTVVIFGLESLSQWGYAYGFMTIAQNMQHRLRIDAYRRMQLREIRFFEEHRLGKTLAMLNDDVNQLERFLNNAFNEIVQLFVLLAFAGTVMTLISPPLAAIGLLTMPVIIYGSFKFSKMLEPRYRKVRESVGDVASRLENNIGGILVIKSFTAENYEAERVEQASEAYRKANHHAIKLNSVFIPIVRMGIALGFAAVIVLGGWWVMQGRLTAGELVLFCMMIQRLLWPLTRLGQTFDDYQRAKASATRVFGLLDTPSAVQDPAEPVPMQRARGEVEFDSVFFRYRNREPVLNGLSLHVMAGEMVGIAGTTGAGKSTLIKLLLRLYDVNEGAIKVDGIDVRQVRQEDLRRQIALVSQDVFLFHGTIRENIAYPGVDVLLEKVVEASRHAQFDDFVQSLPEGYETIVGERGIKLSGGQRQRLSIARALLKDAPILVLDEATSSVDTETERMIQQNLEELTAGRTALVIAHRLSTIRKADRIIVIKDGAVEEEGTHESLITHGGTYADLWAVQSGTVDSIVHQD
ncbi:MAG: ABC transporter ATP-binding protein [Planctomycetes bacterium]|nr:ABC transporter ATP-binding protein [Planctomycetota bacterium]MCW8134500.1 ABC transporter ATP-binding protein [Planctomycetota bacterium]